MAVRVLVCDDSLGFPALVASWLDADGRFAPVGPPDGGRALLRLAQSTPADALVLDLVLPDVDNPGQLVRELRGLQPELKVLLVSSLHEAELARAADAAGVDGHLHKLTNADEFGDRLAALTAG